LVLVNMPALLSIENGHLPSVRFYITVCPFTAMYIVNVGLDNMI